MSYRRVQEESDELLRTVWSLVMVRNQLPAQMVEGRGKCDFTRNWRASMQHVSKDFKESVYSKLYIILNIKNKFKYVLIIY